MNTLEYDTKKTKTKHIARGDNNKNMIHMLYDNRKVKSCINNNKDQ